MGNALSRATRLTLRRLRGWRAALLVALIVGFTIVSNMLLCQPDRALSESDPGLYERIYGSGVPTIKCLAYGLATGFALVLAGLLVIVAVRSIVIMRSDRAAASGRIV